MGPGMDFTNILADNSLLAYEVCQILDEWVSVLVSSLYKQKRLRKFKRRSFLLSVIKRAPVNTIRVSHFAWADIGKRQVIYLFTHLSLQVVPRVAQTRSSLIHVAGLHLFNHVSLQVAFDLK